MHSIRDIAVPLRTLEPATSDYSDLVGLREVVGNARVVCLGESAHFVSEFYRLRDRVMRFLVRELGFSAFVLESGLPEGLAVDDWVTGGPGDLDEIARTGISYAFGRSEEMHAQLRWMRDWNSGRDDKVHFYGMDVPGWCANPGPGVSACLARLPSRPGDRELLAIADLGEPTRAPSPDAAGTVGPQAGLSCGIDELVERAAAVGDEIALRCARGAQRVVEFLAHGLYPGPGRNLRNEVMAENIGWILDRERRIIVSAHNVHLQRSPSFDGTAPIGSLLAPVLGNDLVVIGTTRATGSVPDLDLDADPPRRYFASVDEPPPPPPHSLDAVMDSADLPFHLVDLRHVPQTILAAGHLHRRSQRLGDPLPLPRQQNPDPLGPTTGTTTTVNQRARHVESPVCGDAYAGFGRGPRETDQWQHQHRARGLSHRDPLGAGLLPRRNLLHQSWDVVRRGI